MSTNAYQELLSLKCINNSQSVDAKDFLGKLVLVLSFRPTEMQSEIYIQKFNEWAEHYKDHMVLAFVYSPVYDGENNIDLLQASVHRYAIKSPVFFDEKRDFDHIHGFKEKAGVIVYDQLGRRRFLGSGMLDLKKTHDLCLQLMNQSLQTGTTRKLNSFLLSRTLESSEFLRFPSRITFDANKSQLYIADSGHHRILICDLNGKVIDQIGSGELGDEEGDFDATKLNFPQGMCLLGDKLYFADTWNHRINCADLKNRQVNYLVGNGVMNFHTNVMHKGQRLSLSCPTDVKVLEISGKDQLVISNTGSQQILKYDFASGIAESYAGNGRGDGREDILSMASFLNPQYLNSQIPGFLFVSDSMRNALCLCTKTNMKNLFKKGESDLAKNYADLSYPTGLCWNSGSLLYLLDSMNKRILSYSITEKKLTIVSDSMDELLFPSDICYLEEDKLLILDRFISKMYLFTISTKSLEEFNFKFDNRTQEIKRKLDELPIPRKLVQEQKEFRQSLKLVEFIFSLDIPNHLVLSEDTDSRLLVYEKHSGAWYLVRDLVIDQAEPDLDIRLANVGKTDHYVVDLKLQVHKKGHPHDQETQHHRMHIEKKDQGNMRPIHWKITLK
ncbi:MAG: hypothetical protein VX642_15475 [Bdellovibrionota bacterium]|nr:hypothetical protein [Bdellovibrionota bacterium]